MKTIHFHLFFLFVAIFNPSVYAQYPRFTPADTLRGMLRPERLCYDITYYDLAISIDINAQTIRGFNTIHFKTLRGFNMLQLDLFANMQIDSIVHYNRNLKYYRKYNAFFVDFGEMQEENKQDSITIYYHGKPIIAVNPPWDGGFSWSKDKQGFPFIGVSCEGIGASLWWPNKDHLSDEPDSMRIRCTVPKHLQCISNGVLRRTSENNGETTFDWFVSYPINNYSVTLNIAKYVHFVDTFVSPTDKSKLALDYYVLPYNLEKAKKQFQQVPKILESFERHLDKYPFWRDGFALVETSYLGMEHQGAIAYGNQYMQGYLGRHIPGVPEDFIILHETGHEWWGNSVSCNDLAEMWLHETFTTYMEVVYVEDIYGFDKAVEYLQADALFMENTSPMLAPFDVNYDAHSTDIYYKGAIMLHTLRRVINNDVLWWDLIRSFYQKHKIGHTKTTDFIQHVEELTKQDFGYFFKQYLEYAALPVLKVEAKMVGKKTEVSLQWEANVDDFRLPIWIGTSEGKKQVTPGTKNATKILIPNPKAKNIEIEFGLFVTDWKVN